jgi:hypothetical protein
MKWYKTNKDVTDTFFNLKCYFFSGKIKMPLNTGPFGFMGNN